MKMVIENLIELMNYDTERLSVVECLVDCVELKIVLDEHSEVENVADVYLVMSFVVYIGYCDNEIVKYYGDYAIWSIDKKSPQTNFIWKPKGAN